MSADSAWPLQKAVYDALAAAPAVQALLGDPARIYDSVPPGAAFPYLAIGEATAADWSAKSFAGVEARLTLHVFSTERGAKQAKAVLDAVHGVLHDAALPVAGHNLASLRFEFAATLLDEDGLTWHGLARYRALTHL
jgi:Protein of unknown function (DUF3168)